jgi:hypothetical protein
LLLDCGKIFSKAESVKRERERGREKGGAIRIITKRV